MLEQVDTGVSPNALMSLFKRQRSSFNVGSRNGAERVAAQSEDRPAGERAQADGGANGTRHSKGCLVSFLCFLVPPKNTYHCLPMPEFLVGLRSKDDAIQVITVEAQSIIQPTEVGTGWKIVGEASDNQILLISRDAFVFAGPKDMITDGL